MPIVTSTIAAKIAASLLRGPSVGSHGAESAGKLHVLTDEAVMPVGTIASATEYVRFGKLPAGAKIIRHLSLLSSNHSATVSGKLVLRPLDGSTAVEITSVVMNLEATETTCIPDVASAVTITTDSYVDFVPAADLTIASTAKTAYLALAYTLNS